MNANPKTTIFPPDLLNRIPTSDPRLKVLKKHLSFAFCSGDSAGSLKKDLDTRVSGPSSWDASCFSADLFVSELIETCMLIEGQPLEKQQSVPFLKRVLCAPPGDLDTVRFRQDILKELLEKSELREMFESAWKKLVGVRTLLDGAGLMGQTYSIRRRIEILTEIKLLVEQLAASFSNAGEGLRRIGEFGVAFRSSPGFLILNEFLDYENHLATVEFRVQVGPDGTVRQFHLISASENRKGRFYSYPFRRFIDRIKMAFRGYGLQSGELVARWVDTVFDCVADYVVHALSLLGDMEFYMAGLAFADSCAKRKLPTCFPEFIEGGAGQGRQVANLFNPLLFRQELLPVPCSISIANPDAMTIVTGPNSGGKTRLLQALGILQILAQSGLSVPAQKARIRFASGLFVSLLEGAQVDQNEGRLGMELLRVRRLFEKSSPNALVLLDELCAGTNPSEGEEIFRLVISLLTQLNPEAFISTHFLSFAARLEAQNCGELDFIQVELDENKKPTYRFIGGVATTSLAGLTAERLGVTREKLLALIETKRR